MSTIEKSDSPEVAAKQVNKAALSFGLTLQTRLIEFGRRAIARRRSLGLGKPETFNFLGFTHYCATRRNRNGFVLGRKPIRKRMQVKLREIKERLQAMRHGGIERQGKWLAQVLRGWLAYYAVPMSAPAITAFRHHMIERWHSVLLRRSQRSTIDVGPDERDCRALSALSSHPAPVAGATVPRHHPRQEPSALAAPAGILCGGRRAISVPTATRAPAPVSK